jgi:hypothetical protein
LKRVVATTMKAMPSASATNRNGPVIMSGVIGIESYGHAAGGKVERVDLNALVCRAAAGAGWWRTGILKRLEVKSLHLVGGSVSSASDSPPLLAPHRLPSGLPATGRREKTSRLQNLKCGTGFS